MYEVCNIKAVSKNVKDINFSKAITCICKTVCPLIHVPYHCVEIFFHKKCTKQKLVNSKKESIQSFICGWNLKINVLRGYLEVSIHDVFKCVTTDSFVQGLQYRILQRFFQIKLYL